MIADDGSILPSLLAVMQGVDVVFIGVHCARAELGPRVGREDRVSGTGTAQLGSVHAHGNCEAEADISADALEVCSAGSVNHVKRNQHRRVGSTSCAV